MSDKNPLNIIRRTLVVTMSLFMTISVFGYLQYSKEGSRIYPPDTNFTSKKEISKGEVLSRMKEKVAVAKEYVDVKGFDVSYCFLVDMRIPSGKNRFFVYNLLKDSLEAAGLVTHGKGSEKGSEDLFFSNRPNSLCTSLGRYKMGESYTGSFGLSYKLYGLDKTNDKALERAVVLHSYFGVPDKEVYPNQLSFSEGCPAVSPEFFAQLKAYMDESQEPILLWIYY